MRWWKVLGIAICLVSAGFVLVLAYGAYVAISEGLGY